MVVFPSVIDFSNVRSESAHHLANLAYVTSSGGQVATVTGISGTHHVLGVEHLLGQLGNSQGAVLLRTTAGQWNEADHEEVQTRERNHVDGKFAEVRVELTRETKAGGGARHGGRHEVV